MGQTRRKKAEPSLELPSIPGFGRRKKLKRETLRTNAPDLDDAPYEEPTRSLDEPTLAPQEDLSRTLPETDHATYDEDTDLLTEEEAPRRRSKKQKREKPRQKTREPRTTPLLPGRVAALLTGLVVGAAGAAGTYGAMTGCEAVRGVSSCGGAPGFFILVAIVVLMILLGTGILKLLRVGDAGSTSFLAVGLVAVIVMLVLLDVIFSVAMFAVVPALSALSFVLAHWVTTRFADDKGRRDWT